MKATNRRPPAIPETNPFACGNVSWSPRACTGKPSRCSNSLLPNHSRATPHASSIARPICAPGSSVGKNIMPSKPKAYATAHTQMNSPKDFACAIGLVSETFRFDSSIVTMRMKSVYAGPRIIHRRPRLSGTGKLRLPTGSLEGFRNPCYRRKRDFPVGICLTVHSAATRLIIQTKQMTVFRG